MRTQGTVAFVIAALAIASSAEAGPVSTTVGGIGNKTGGDGARPTHPTGGTNNGNADGYCETNLERERERERWRRRELFRVEIVNGQPVILEREEKPEPPGFGGTADVYAGVTKVKDSDGAGFVEASANSNRVGIVMRVIGYYEGPGSHGLASRSTEPQPMESANASTLMVWDIAGRLKVIRDGSSSLFVEAGVAGLVPGGLKALNGYEAGLSLEHKMSEETALFASARGYAFSNDITAYGLAAGVKWNMFRGGLRLLDFNVGPPLVGPEVGVMLGF